MTSPGLKAYHERARLARHTQARDAIARGANPETYGRIVRPSPSEAPAGAVWDDYAALDLRNTAYVDWKDIDEAGIYE